MENAKRIRQIEELSPEDSAKASSLLRQRARLKQFEDEVQAMVKETVESLKALLEQLTIDSLVSSQYGRITMTDGGTRTSYSEEDLTMAMKDAKISQKKIQSILDAARKTSITKPYIKYTKPNGK